MVSGKPKGRPRKVTEAHVTSIRAIFDGNLGKRITTQKLKNKLETAYP